MYIQHLNTRYQRFRTPTGIAPQRIVVVGPCLPSPVMWLYQGPSPPMPRGPAVLPPNVTQATPNYVPNHIPYNAFPIIRMNYNVPPPPPLPQALNTNPQMSNNNYCALPPAQMPTAAALMPNNFYQLPNAADQAEVNSIFQSANNNILEPQNNLNDVLENTQRLETTIQIEEPADVAQSNTEIPLSFEQLLIKNLKCLSSVELSLTKLQELTQLTIQGSATAEKVAYTYRNRPCFKKIDSLCARLKQDIARSDAVIPNINSQGIAWAVKDLIFVFTRILNAWIIIKGYVYTENEGLEHIKSAMSDDFTASFAAWQDSTLVFAANLVKSFKNLDDLAKSQRTHLNKTESPNNNAENQTYYTLSETLEQMNLSANASTDFKAEQPSTKKNSRVYLKTGTYNPIKKNDVTNEKSIIEKNFNEPLEECETTSSDESVGEASGIETADNVNDVENKTNQSLVNYINSTEYHNDLNINMYMNVPNAVNILQNHNAQITNVNAVVQVQPCAYKTRKTLELKEKLPPNWINYDIRVLVDRLSEFSQYYDPRAPPIPLNKNFIKLLNILMDRIMDMKHAEYFFDVRHTGHYFPDFYAMYGHQFKDLRTILHQGQIGGYKHLNEVVYDIRRIYYIVKIFLNKNNNVRLFECINMFEIEMEKILKTTPFDVFDFSYIIGGPNVPFVNIFGRV